MPALASFLGLSTHRRTLSKPTEKLMDVEIEHAFFCLACLTFGGKQGLHPLPQFQWMGTSMVKMRREGIFSKSRQRSAIGVEKGQFQGENGNDFGLLDKSLFWNLFSIDRGSERWMDSSINHFSLSWTFFRPKGIAFSLRCGRLFPPYFLCWSIKYIFLGVDIKIHHLTLTEYFASHILALCGCPFIEGKSGEFSMAGCVA